MMRILFLTNFSSLADGIARHILTLCRYFSKFPATIQVAVCITNGEGDFSYALEKAGVRVYFLDAKNGHDFRIFKRFSKIMKDFNPTLIHCHVLSCFVRIMLSFFYRHIPVIGTVHGISDPPTNTQRTKQYLSKCLDYLFPLNLQKTLYISGEVARELNAGELVTVCYNPIDSDECSIAPKQHIREELKLSDNVKLAGFIGRLTTQKDLASFLRMATLVNIKFPNDVHFLIVGSGPDESLQTTAEVLALGNCLTWLGYRKDAPVIMAELDVFVMTSLREGLPTTALEAFRAKVPLCAFRSPGGVEEIYLLAQKENFGDVAHFIEGRDCEALATAVCDTLENTAHNTIQTNNAFRMLQKHFDVKVVGEQLLSIYRKFH